MKTTEAPVIVEHSFQASLSEAWAAVTEVGQMTQWFFENIGEFDPKVGFETKFLVEVEDKSFTHLWRLTEVIFENKITYDWSYEEYTGRGLVTFELSEEGDQTLVKLTNVVIEDFPDDIPEFTRESCIGGWEYFIGERLKKYLER